MLKMLQILKIPHLWVCGLVIYSMLYVKVHYHQCGNVWHGFDCFLTCDVEILDWSWRAVRSEDETLAGAPRWSRMLTFLSLSAREIARGDVLPKIMHKAKNNIWCRYPRKKTLQCKHSVIMLLKDRSLILLKQLSSTLTRLLDLWSRVRDGLLWPVADSVGSSRIRTRRETTRRRAPGGSSNPLISVISRPSLSIPILCCSTGTLTDYISHITVFPLSKSSLKLSVLYRNEDEHLESWRAKQTNTYVRKTSHKLTNLSMFQSKT